MELLQPAMSLVRSIGTERSRNGEWASASVMAFGFGLAVGQGMGPGYGARPN